VLTFAGKESVWSIGRRLRAEKFDTALILPNSTRSALEAWLAGIPQRLGYGGAGRSWLLTQAIRPRADALPMRKRSVPEIRKLIQAPPATSGPVPAAAHHLHHYLHLVSALGAQPEPLPPLIHVTAAEVQDVHRRFALESGGRTFFGLNAGAEYGPAKRWPRERFVAVARELQQRTKCQWILFGGPADVELAGHISDQVQAAATAPVLNLAGRTSLRELCAALQTCRVLLTNDTGPMHVAAAVGTPVVALFGSTSPELTGPGLPGDDRHQLLKSNAPCAPCFLRACPIDFRCLNGVGVESVVAAVLRAAGEWQPPANSARP
jgi:heptosyltransferase-2